ncbi:glutathione ABC transporter permease GsiD [Spirochaetia bacterium]|nr:glutathione ABC transporter permease GsiD [Spirochaetia bacterium]
MTSRILINRMRHNPFFVTGFIIAALIVLLIILSPLIVQYDPVQNVLTGKFLSPEGFKDGLRGHILGTDQLGRDVFTRLLLGGRYSLTIAAAVVILQVLIGVTLGMLAGYFGGVIDAIIMRACDVFLAIPVMILAIAVISILGASMFNLVAVLTFHGWIYSCKITRNNVRIMKQQEFVHASVALGAKNWHIMWDQIFPNVTTHIIILSSQRVGLTILIEAALSFLNVGIQPPIPSWGNMIAAGRQYMTTRPWLVFAPGIALMFTVLAFNFLGDGLRDVLDPKRGL